jgi:hypothetical protein
MTYFLPIVVVWLMASFAVGLWFRALEREQSRIDRDREVLVGLDWPSPDFEEIR